MRVGPSQVMRVTQITAPVIDHQIAFILLLSISKRESPEISRILLKRILFDNHSSSRTVACSIQQSTWKFPSESLGAKKSLFLLTSRFDLAPRRACLFSLQRLEMRHLFPKTLPRFKVRPFGQSPVHPFCCAGPQLSLDGRYPLRCSVVSGLSSPRLKVRGDCLPNFPERLYKLTPRGFPLRKPLDWHP